MSNKYFGGVVADKGVSDTMDEDLKQVVLSTVDKVNAKMNDLRVADAISEIFVLFKRCNKYIDETMPWLWPRIRRNRIVWQQFSTTW